MALDDNRRLTAQGLLGGYATGSLTEAERRFLFEAALEDQEIFDQLAHEQALKDAIETPGVRDRLAASLAPQSAGGGWKKPLAWGLAAMFVVGVSLAAVMLTRSGDREQMAQLNQPAPVTAPGAPAVESPAPPPAPIAASKPGAVPKKKAAEPAVAGEVQSPPVSVARSSSIAIPLASQPGAAVPPAPQARPMAPVPTAQIQSGRTGFAQQSADAAAATAPSRFAFDYSIDDQDLVFHFTADGYFSLHIAPGGLTIVDSHVTAGSTRRERINSNGTEADITFTAVPQAPAGGVSIVRAKESAKAGTVEDPGRARIDLLLRFYY
jgi:hypothetical protein